MHMVCVFSTRTVPDDSDVVESPFTHALGTFYGADEKRRNGMLKLIPQVRRCQCRCRGFTAAAPSAMWPRKVSLP